MAVDIRAELQPINELLIAMNSLAQEAIDLGMNYGRPPHWAMVLQCLSERGLEVFGDAEASLLKQLGGA